MQKNISTLGCFFWKNTMVD